MCFNYHLHLCGFPPGLGIWYYRSRKNQQDPSTKDEKQIKKKLVEPSASVSVTDETKRIAKNTPVVEEEDPYKQAQTHKNKGNKYFKDGKYSDAIKCYQQAIDVCPKDKVQDVSTFHQNRAAAFEQLVCVSIVITMYYIF